MAERLNAAVLKTVVPRGTVGSNPTSSARNYKRTQYCVRFSFISSAKNLYSAKSIWPIYQHLVSKELFTYVIKRHFSAKPQAFSNCSLLQEYANPIKRFISLLLRKRYPCRAATSWLSSRDWPRRDRKENRAYPRQRPR